MCAQKNRQQSQQEPRRTRSWHNKQDKKTDDAVQTLQESPSENLQPAKALKRQREPPNAENADVDTGNGQTKQGGTTKRIRKGHGRGADSQTQGQLAVAGAAAVQEGPKQHQREQRSNHQTAAAAGAAAEEATEQPPDTQRSTMIGAAAPSAVTAQQSMAGLTARGKQPQQRQRQKRKQPSRHNAISDSGSDSSSSSEEVCSGSESEYQPSDEEGDDEQQPKEAELFQGGRAGRIPNPVLHAAAAVGEGNIDRQLQQQKQQGFGTDPDKPAEGAAAEAPQQQQQQQGSVLERPLTARGIAQTSLDRYLQQQQQEEQQWRQQQQRRHPTGQYISFSGQYRNRPCHIVHTRTTDPFKSKIGQPQQQQQQQDQQSASIACGYINVSKYSEAGYYKARITIPKAARRLLGLPQDVTIAPLCETPELAARAADMGAIAILGVHLGMKLNFPLDSYTPDEQRKRSGVDLQQYLEAIRGKKRKLAPAAAAARLQRLLGRQQSTGGSSSTGAAARRGLQQQRRQQQQQHRKCGLCTGCLAGRLCVLTLWKRHTPQAGAAAARAAVKLSRPGGTALRKQLDFHTAEVEIQLRLEHMQQLAIEYPEAVNLVIPLRPAAAALAAAPSVAAAAAAALASDRQQDQAPEAANADADGSNAATPAAQANGQDVATAAAAAAAALSSLNTTTTAAVAAAVKPSTGARLSHYGSLPVHQEPETARIINPHGPTPRPGLRFQQQLTSAAVAAAAGLSCVQVSSTEPVKPACRACGSLLHLYNIRDLCPVHRNLVQSDAAAAAAAAAAGEVNAQCADAAQGNSWVNALGPEGVHLVMALRKLADDILGDDVRVLQEREQANAQTEGNKQQQQQQQSRRRGWRRLQEQKAAAADPGIVGTAAEAVEQQGVLPTTGANSLAATAAAEGAADVQQHQQQRRPVGLDPWSFVAAAVVLQEVSREVLNPTRPEP